MLSSLVVTALAAAGPAPASVYDLEPAAFVQQARADLRTLKVYATSLRTLHEGLKTEGELFQKRSTEPYSPEQKVKLLSSWGAFFSYVFSIEGLRQRYWDFVKVNPTDPKHAWGFVLTHAALTAELAYGLGFADLAAGNKQLEVLLDEPNGEFGVPARAFTQLKNRVLHVGVTTQLVTGDAYARGLGPLYRRAAMHELPDVRWALAQMRAHSKSARRKLLGRGANLFVRNAADIAKDATFAALFPVQKSVAAWMGDTRVRRSGRPLISYQQALQLTAVLEPGDILVARQNWFISNVGLPGFWPHAELYLGTPEDLRAMFDGDAEVRGYTGGGSVVDHLARRFPRQWRRYTGVDFQGNGPIRVIESISEGVSFTAVEHALQVDYLGAMRPRLSKLEKLKAIERAFAYQGRPYDFDFNFFSDATLVCTELVWKAYAPAGLTVPLVDVAGRRTLPANELVKLFDREYDDARGRQLDFVAFLDGREELQAAVAGDLEAFRASHRRAKWDVAQR